MKISGKTFRDNLQSKPVLNFNTVQVRFSLPNLEGLSLKPESAGTLPPTQAYVPVAPKTFSPRVQSRAATRKPTLGLEPKSCEDCFRTSRPCFCFCCPCPFAFRPTMSHMPVSGMVAFNRGAVYLRLVPGNAPSSLPLSSRASAANGRNVTWPKSSTAAIMTSCRQSLTARSRFTLPANLSRHATCRSS